MKFAVFIRCQPRLKKTNKNASSFLRIDFTMGIYLLADHMTKECKHIVFLVASLEL